METQHFQKKYRRRSPKTDKEFKDGRRRLADKSELREQVFLAAGGECEYEKVRGLPHHPACSRRVSLSFGQLAHKHHGAGKRDDTLEGCFWASKPCHQLNDHGTHGVPRRPGKIMKITDAQVYWEGNTCFCDGDKKPKESFCGDCRPKVQPQTMYTLENTDDPLIYREALACAELEILQHGLS